MDVLSVGEMVIDFLPGNEPNSFIAHAGGAPANVAISVARNGLSSGFIGKVGDDTFGKMLISTLKEEGVAIPNDIITTKAVTTMAFVHLDQHGERSFTFARKPGADMFLDSDDVKHEYLRDAIVIHAGSCSLSAEPASSATRQALSSGKLLGKIVSFDLNYRNLMWNDAVDTAKAEILSVLPSVDILKISEEERFILSPYGSVFEFMEAHTITLVVETLGREGAVCHYQGKSFRKPIFDGPRVDTTGAGDAFYGAFLSTLITSGVTSPEDLSEDILTEALIAGNVAGGLCVRSKGAIHSLPKKDELTEAIALYRTKESSGA
ncbi:MAG: carbohydrate kinase [Sphaerochaetaceae bacterium]|nr:carbohydrate kinase [Sphaerochaetaceae bacterium]